LGSTLDWHSHDILLNPFSQAVVLVTTKEDTKTWNSPHAKFSWKLSGFELKMQLNKVFLRNLLR